jgi:hypothetical protein
MAMTAPVTTDKDSVHAIICAHLTCLHNIRFQSSDEKDRIVAAVSRDSDAFSHRCHEPGMMQQRLLEALAFPRRLSSS